MAQLGRTACFSLGSNLGNREQTIQEATLQMEAKVGPVRARSAWYESTAWGYDSPNPFLNVCIEIHTNDSPEEILKKTQQIEFELGRISTSGPNSNYSDRVIDIDLILLGDITFESPGLTIPHPLFRKRLFVLLPLSEIVPNAIDPLTNLSVRQLTKNCASPEKITRLDLGSQF